MYFPSKEHLRETVPKGYTASLCKRLGLKIEPVDAYAALRAGGYAFLLESARTGPDTGRYSFVGSEPALIFKSKGDEVEILNGTGTRKFRADPIKELKGIFERYKYAGDTSAPFTGGACGYFGYDLCRRFEKVSSLAKDDTAIPDIFLIFSDTVVAFDHLKKDIKIISAVHNKGSFDRAYDDARERIERAEERLVRVRSTEHRAQRKSGSRKVGNKIESNLTKSAFENMVRKAKRYIKAGDIYQANLSQRLCARTDVEPLDLYKVLRKVNPSPFACLLEFGEIAVVSSSPERLLKFDGRRVDTRPIAGTRPRGKTRFDDRRLSRELLLNEKERAEHIMLVDLERNDLGRVCEYGSVKVNELMAIEEYSHVIHIVSNVRGRLRKDKDRFDLLRAAFPGGTITGTPKVRCMQIIDELEPVMRGIYTGSIGYLGYNGNMDLNIVIRTFLIHKNRAYVQVGAGIVADSDPEREYRETLYKAEALIETLEMA